MTPPSPRSEPSALAILFVDVVGSTALYEERGDLAAKALVEERLRGVRRKVKEHDGRIVKWLGDGLMCSFVDPDAAFAATASIATAGDGQGAAALALRVGLHHGDVVEDYDDLFGDAVNTAARLASAARPGEALISRALIGALRERVDPLIRAVPSVSVKGKIDALDVVTLGDAEEVADGGETLITRAPALDTRALGLALSCGDRTWTLAHEDHRCAVGRDTACDVTLDDGRVSRTHAIIARRGGRLVIVDASTNGTWLVPDGQPALHLVRDEAPMHGRGTLTLGAPPTEGDAPTLRYEVSSD